MCEGGESLFRLSRKILHWHRWWYPCLSSTQKRTFHGDGVDEEEIGGAVVHHQSVSDVREAPAFIFSHTNTVGLAYRRLCRCAQDKRAYMRGVAYTRRQERTRGSDEITFRYRLVVNHHDLHVNAIAEPPAHPHLLLVVRGMSNSLITFSVCASCT